MNTVYVLYLIVNLGPSFEFEVKQVVSVYIDKDLCISDIERMNYGIIYKDFLRLECLPEELVR
jgi:hypothetical protein